MSYSNKKRLPDTPWHVGYAYKEENDPRRLKLWCIHLEGGICKCGFSGCYMTRCSGSSHCKYYAENQGYWTAFLEDMKTDEDRIEEQGELRAAQYQKKKREFVQAQLKSCTYDKRYRFFPSMLKCPFCQGRIKNLSCDYCLAKFKVVKTVTEESIKAAAESGFFLIREV